MLKTLEKNWVFVKVKAYWKRFAEWVIDLENRYWRDAFFRTECKVILLQVLFAAILSVLVALFFNYLYRDILETIINGIVNSLKNKNTVDAAAIVDSIKIIRTKNFVIFFTIALIITIVFSYIIARITLLPVRQSLGSQKRFISDIAHELRTPLAVLKTNSEVALLDDDLPQSLKHILESNIEELDRTSGIINNLLSFNNLIQPEHIKFENSDLSAITEHALHKLMKLAKSKNISVKTKYQRPTIVYGNAVALEQIATNIIKNALSYTPEGGTVSILVAPDYKNNVVLSVTDSGIGIAPKDLRHIFEPFFRAEASRNRRSGSSGLGLAIVSELVKIHGGKVTVKSQVRRGTTVLVYLPFIEDTISEQTKSDEEVSLDFMNRHLKQDKNKHT